ncbi:MAG: methylated-DNA--[protein]-cysteine S-methyltransferase [Desulfobacterales bacterium]|nr:MAG: methylated-DNA--[protein]-cysteine S-methyltransferase [Desulfobacterales bacterium]
MKTRCNRRALEPVTFTYFQSPWGQILVAQNPRGLTAIQFRQGSNVKAPDPRWRFVRKLDGDAVAQLQAYFAGERREFDLPLALEGTPFQREVWMALREIPYGATVAYADLARRIGRPHAFRAVGAANGRNPLPIVVPCHRVIGSDGTLTGYGGGLHIKAALLALERKHRNFRS